MNYEYRFSAVASKIIRLLRDADLCRDSPLPLVRFCCFDVSFSWPWFLNERSFLRDYLDFEHRLRQRTPSALIFAGWHDVGLFAIRPAHWSRFFVAAKSFD